MAESALMRSSLPRELLGSPPRLLLQYEWQRRLRRLRRLRSAAELISQLSCLFPWHRWVVETTRTDAAVCAGVFRQLRVKARVVRLTLGERRTKLRARLSFWPRVLRPGAQTWCSR